ncbi:hypothetical protein GCM10009798_02770 [Nocardioides panacihumi]|uniref:DUF559 domain-containing protein n=1 Tax=Nocardioides panacihumi TaxID=400774 RepID=A0ABN2Q8R5_9ACTN
MSLAPDADREPDQARLDELLQAQHGVVARRQVLECGFTVNDIRRLVRRREWAPAGHPAIFVDHTGPMTWRQRAWAAVLHAWPAALAGESALRAVEGPGRRDRDDGAPIRVAVDRKRSVVRREGIVIQRLSRLAARVQWSTSPPRLRTEEALLDLAAGSATELAAIGRLADAVNARLTTPARLLDTLASRPRIPRRRFLANTLADVRDGTCSVLEHGYLVGVERAHGPPRPRRQAPTGVGRPGFRDIDYPELGIVVELDGRLGHDGSAARDRDLERDLDARVAAGRVTVRLGWGQVFDRPCSTAVKVAQLLQRHGWQGAHRPCARCAQTAQTAQTAPWPRVTG